MVDFQNMKRFSCQRHPSPHLLETTKNKLQMANKCTCELEALKTYAVSCELTIPQFINVGSLLSLWYTQGTHSRDSEEEA